MTNQHIQNFFRQYPGPFACSSNFTGVKDVFTVFCKTSRAPIMTDFYCKDRELAELTAESICFALSMLSSGETQSWTTETLPVELQRLNARYPGPYGISSSDGYMPSFEIICLRTKNVVFNNYAYEDTARGRLIAETTAAALNAVRQPRILDRSRMLLAAI